MKLPAQSRFASRARFALATLVAGLCACPIYAAQLTLADFRGEFDRSRIAATDAEIVEARQGDQRSLRVLTGSRERWPGITIFPASGHWDLSQSGALLVHLQNVGTRELKVFCRVDNPGADGVRNCLTADLKLAPGKSGALRVELRASAGDTLDGKLFGMRGYPVAQGGKGTVDPARISQILLFVAEPKSPQAFELERIEAVDTPSRPTAWVTDAVPFFPFIDTFGQYRHATWPGKVGALEELRQRRDQEARELQEATTRRSWDRYGGWSEGPQLAATGFFRVQKHDGRWWLVDPEGRLFWSHGVDCVMALDFTPVDERATWLVDSPIEDAAFAEFVSSHAFALKGHFAGRSPRSFSFAGANLRRKYGPDWKSSYPHLVQQRLRNWGLNTLANWSNAGVARLRQTPYTDSLQTEHDPMIEGSEGYWGKFPDVFDPAFADGLRRALAAKKGGSVNDPWCLGYFSHNEMSWGDEVSLAEATLRSRSSQPAKRAFLERLRARYAEIERLNQKWGTTHASWAAFLASTEPPERAKARPDLEDFYGQLAEQYFRTVRDVLREAAPHQLYLGCRFAWANARAAAAAAKYCDVVSYNLYQRSIADFVFDGGADVPLLVGEFHFGALDRGLFHTGLVPVADQAARAGAYRAYVEGALRHPQFVGTHWFQWQDEPTIGRVYDEENYQIGLVDIADTPYPEMVAALRSLGDSLYRTRSSTPPTAAR